MRKPSFQVDSFEADPLGRENYEFAKRERFITREDRIFLKLASIPHSPLKPR